MIIDTTNKTVSPQNETLGKVITVLKVMFPGGEWKEYKVFPQVIVQKGYINVNPFVVPYNPAPSPYINPYQPIWLYDPHSQPYYNLCDNDVDCYVTDTGGSTYSTTFTA